MLKIIFISCLFFQTSFYTLSFTDLSNTTHSLSIYQNKKVLLVNIATGSSRVSQLGALQQLQQLYGDSLVVIAFPSNSFGNENRSDSAINQFCLSNYGTTYLIAQKADVKGIYIQPVYSWLKDKAANGSMNSAINGDFQKFLINGSGELVGVFASSIDPMDNLIRNAIENN